MEMEEKEEEEQLKKDLVALRKLYGLLQQTCGDMDESALLLFKNLLDAARDNFLHTHSKMITAAQLDTPFSSKSISNLKPPISSKAPTTKIQSDSHVQSSSKSDHEPLFIKSWLLQAVSERSRLGISSQNSKPQTSRMKRCRVCQQMNAKPRSKDGNYTDEHGVVAGQAVPLSGGLKPVTSQMESDFFKQVSNSVELIDSSILALQISSAGILNPIEATSTPDPKVGETTMSEYGQNGETTCRIWMSGKNKRLPIPENKKICNAKVAQAVELQYPGQSHNMNFSLERVRPVSGAPSQVNESLTYQYVHGLRIPPSQDDGIINRPSHTFKMKEKKKQHNQKTQDSNSLHDSVKRLLVKPMLLDYKSPRLPKSNNPVNSKRGITKRSYMGLQQQKRLLYDQQETDYTPTSSSTYSYSMTNQPESETQSSTNGRDMSRRLSQVASESGIYYGRSSNSSSPYSSSGSYENADIGPLGKAAGRRKIFRSSPDKTIGRLSRLKNKLRLIFHHHHHHHHHQQTKTDKDDSHNDRKGKANTTSRWKNMHKILNHKDKQKFYEKQAVKKVRKVSAVRKNQVGQFQALVKGLMRHVRHSKKSKLSKGGTRHSDHNKHWWKILRHHGGVKLSNKGRVKLQFPSKKQQIKAPKK